MQAPGLFVPGLRACEGRGLFTFLASRRKTSCSHIHSPRRRGEDHTAACFTSAFRSAAPESPVFLSPCLTLSQRTASFFLLAVFLSQRHLLPLEHNKKSSRSACQGERQSISLETFFFFFHLFCPYK